MDIVEWFDINDLSHLQAYKHLTNVGQWPENFIPSDVTLHGCWQATLAFKLANAYVTLQVG